MLAGRIDAREGGRERERESEREGGYRMKMYFWGCVGVCVCERERGGGGVLESLPSSFLLGSVFKDHESAQKLKRITSFGNRGERRRNKQKNKATSDVFHPIPHHPDMIKFVGSHQSQTMRAEM